MYDKQEKALAKTTGTVLVGTVSVTPTEVPVALEQLHRSWKHNLGGSQCDCYESQLVLQVTIVKVIG